MGIYIVDKTHVNMYVEINMVLYLYAEIVWERDCTQVFFILPNHRAWWTTITRKLYIINLLIFYFSLENTKLHVDMV